MNRQDSWVKSPDSVPPTISDVNVKRIGVATCGGDCPALNAVIRAVVRSAIITHGWTVLGIEDSMSGLIDVDYRGPHGNMELDLDKVEDIISKGGTILGCSNRSHPFKFKKVVDGAVQEVDVSDDVVKNFKALGLDALVMIGGDGSMDIASRLMEKGIPVVGVPKTIDNDLLCTDVTFGFDTACQTITEAIDKIRDTAMSHDRVIVIEVMGRDAGWLALQSGIAGAADVILLPEIKYSTTAVLKKVHHRRQNKRFSSIVVIAEGACPAEGSCAFLGERQAGEMIRYGGAADRLEKELVMANQPDKPYFVPDLEVRTSVLGYTQRGGSPSNFDRVLGSRFGLKAVELISEGKFGYMAALQGQSVVGVSMAAVTRGQHFVDPEGELVGSARALGICMGDEWPPATMKMGGNGV